MGLTAEMFGEYAVRLAERRLGDDDLEPVGRLGRFASLRRGWEIACGECFEEKALDLAGEPSFVRGGCSNISAHRRRMWAVHVLMRRLVVLA